MQDILQQIQVWAEELGLTYARIITDKKVLNPKIEVRNACLANACGKSGKSWTCPPHVGEFEELGEQMRAFDHIVVFQYIAPLEDSWDFEGMEEAGRKLNESMREIRRRLTDKGLKNLALGSGGCGFCSACTCPDQPCVFPEEALSSVEGYGLDVKALVESVGLKYINGVNTVSYVGAVFI